MKRDDVSAQVAIAARACLDKKAEDLAILRLDASASGFTDYFVICSGANPRQVEAIAEEVDQKLSKAGFEPSHIEGRRQAEWILLDYVHFVVHVFSENARKFYDLERLWKTATRIEPAELEKPAAKKATVPTLSKKKGKDGAATGTKRSPIPSLSQKKGKDGAPKSKRTRKS
jgi:ribosome-associated protein